MGQGGEEIEFSYWFFFSVEVFNLVGISCSAGIQDLLKQFLKTYDSNVRDSIHGNNGDTNSM